MSRRLVSLALLALLAGAPAARAGPRNWWDRDWTHRKRVALRETQQWADAPAAHVRIATAGRAKEDGSDIRVIAKGGREVPRRIAARGPGDLFEVAFPVGNETEWDVYYGNPEARAPPKPFVPDRGLVLTTRARGPGSPTSWEAMQQILANSPRVFGGSYWPRVFDAENPFGPSDDFVSDYRGHLHVGVPGTYTFFTASDEASFLLVNGAVVAEWPGWHDAGKGAWGTFKGRVKLEAGFHDFRYVHVERTGAQVMAAYWQPPGATKGRVIEAAAFPGLRTAVVASVEVRGKDVAADFTATVAEKWGLENRVYVGMTMKAALAGDEAAYGWDFGDGTRGEGPIVHHVYLRGGSYDVALTVSGSGDRDTAIRTIHVPDQWTRLDRNLPEVMARFARIAATYPAERIAAEPLERLSFLLEQAGLEEELASLMQTALDESKLLRDRDRYAVGLKLGEYYRDRTLSLDGALLAFRRASEVEDPELEVRAQIRMAEALVMLGGDAPTALRILDHALRTLGKAGGDDLRLAQLRAGDACMEMGDGATAREHYSAALDLAGGPEDSRRILRKAAAMRTAMTLLETGDRDRLPQALRDWEWYDPMDRYGGLHRLARARALYAVFGNAGLAARELQALLAGNPESEYADQALALLAGIAEERGDSEAAKTYRERLRRDYPWSPLAR